MKNIDLDYKIENVVATVSVEIPEKIDLNQIARKYTDVEYNPERFPGLVMRLENPRATVLIFSTGKMVITGLNNAKEAELVAEKVVKNIGKAGIIVFNPKITIQNFGASGNLPTNLDLIELQRNLMDVTYEPEVFPGLIHRMQNPKVVFLLFSTGRFVCTGAKSEDEVIEAIIKFNLELDDRAE